MGGSPRPDFHSNLDSSRHRCLGRPSLQWLGKCDSERIQSRKEPKVRHTTDVSGNWKDGGWDVEGAVALHSGEQAAGPAVVGQQDNAAIGTEEG